MTKNREHWLLSFVIAIISLFSIFHLELQADHLETSLGPEMTLLPGGVFPFMFLMQEGTLIVNTYIYPNRGAQDRPDFGKPLPGPGIPFSIRSENGGKSWQVWSPGKDTGINSSNTPQLAAICDHEYCRGSMGPATQGSIVQLRDGTILMFDYQPEGLRDGEFVGRMWRSVDDWKTVIGPEETFVHVADAPQWAIGDHNKNIAGMAFFGPGLELPDGELLTTMYGVFRGDKFPSQTDDPHMKKFRSVLVRSTDRGKNWNYVSTIAVGNVGEEGFPEPCVLRLKQGRHKGRLICVMRTGTKNPMYQAISDDGGKTWSRPRELNLVGVAPRLIEMTSGVLALSFGHKPDYRDDGNFVAFSLDQGETWTHVVRLSSNMTGAYTSVVEISPGVLFVVYDERKGYYVSTTRWILGRTVTVALKPEE